MTASENMDRAILGFVHDGVFDKEELQQNVRTHVDEDVYHTTDIERRIIDLTADGHINGCIFSELTSEGRRVWVDCIYGIGSKGRYYLDYLDSKNG